MSAEILSYSPSRPSELVAAVPAADAAAVDAAVGRAVVAGADWHRAGGLARCADLVGLAEALEARAAQLADLICREVGKPISEAKAEVARAVAIVRFHAQASLDADGETLPAGPGAWTLMTRRVPRGVCGLITPWNFPLAIPLWKAAPALACGNAVLLKPASPAVGCGAALAELFEATLPAAVAQLLPGGRETAEALIDHPGVDCISFTGSEAVGRSVIERAGRRALPVQAEMGGQNPSIVLADANLERAATTIAGAAMGYAGQKCTATSRIVVERPVLERFVPLLLRAVADLSFGDPTELATDIGPVISNDSMRDAETAVDAARERGGRLLTGGEAPAGPGSFMPPTLVELAGPNDPLAQEEVFAPVAGVVAADGVDEALEIANGVRFGLSAAVFTRDLTNAARAIDALEAGLVRINQSTAGVDLHAPFGGVKGSSFGPREQGRAGREFFSITRTISIATENPMSNL